MADGIEEWADIPTDTGLVGLRTSYSMHTQAVSVAAVRIVDWYDCPMAFDREVIA